MKQLDAVLQAKKAILRSRDQKIVQLTDGLASKDKQLTEKNKVIADLQAKVSSLEKENHQWQVCGGSIERENAQLKERLAEAVRIMEVPHTQDWYYVDGKG